MCAMKLFLTWLLGVPFLVTSMVMAQSLLVPDQPAGIHAPPGSQRCSGQRDPHNVAPLIAKQGYRNSCDQLAIH